MLHKNPLLIRQCVLGVFTSENKCVTGKTASFFFPNEETSSEKSSNRPEVAQKLSARQMGSGPSLSDSKVYVSEPTTMPVTWHFDEMPK